MSSYTEHQLIRVCGIYISLTGLETLVCVVHDGVDAWGVDTLLVGSHRELELLLELTPNPNHSPALLSGLSQSQEFVGTSKQQR